LASAPAETARTEPAPGPDKKAVTPKSGGPGQTTQNSTVKPKSLQPPKQDDVPRPPRGISRSQGSPFGYFR
jgi:hypothetical protein